MLQLDREDHIGAAVPSNARRQAGVHLGTIEGALARLAIRHDLTLLTTDKDFTHAATLRAHRVWPATVQAKR